MKKHIPNFITCLNLFSGCIAIVLAFNSELSSAAIFIAAALIFDFLDGFVARLLMVQSEIGKQLDSLADMVTFGVLPGVIMFHLINNALIFKYGNWNIPSNLIYLKYVGFLITVFSGIRLAKFNIDTRQSESFIGLPTPANTIFIASFPLILATSNQKTIIHLILNPTFLVIISVIMSLLLVAELPLFALKFKNFSWADNKVRFVFLLISILFLLVFKLLALPLIIVLYVLLSFLSQKLLK